MIDREVVTLFDDLKTKYPMAAAGLIEQLCANLSQLLESAAPDENAIASACETIAECFRPMDRSGVPDSYPRTLPMRYLADGSSEAYLHTLMHCTK